MNKKTNGKLDYRFTDSKYAPSFWRELFMVISGACLNKITPILVKDSNINVF
jgi:hypothetical protein